MLWLVQSSANQNRQIGAVLAEAQYFTKHQGFFVLMVAHIDVLRLVFICIFISFCHYKQSELKTFNYSEILNLETVPNKYCALKDSSKKTTCFINKKKKIQSHKASNFIICIHNQCANEPLIINVTLNASLFRSLFLEL